MTRPNLRKNRGVAVIFALLFALIALTGAIYARPRVGYKLPSTVLTLLEKRAGLPLYMAAYNMLVRVRYSPADERLFLDMVPAPKGVQNTIHEIPAHEGVLVQFKAGFTASLMIISCGDTFGDDPCDQYSPINQRVQFGRNIKDESLQDFGRYVQAIERALKP